MKFSGVERYDKRVLNWFNVKLDHLLLDRFFEMVTHFGGATITIFSTLTVLLFAPAPWRMAALCSLLALTFSHLAVSIIKKSVVRIRPYIALPNIRTGKVQFKDHSFPSGHTTAIFSVVVPFVCVAPWLGAILIPLAITVAMSRVYLGMHYPSDCVAGGLLGSVTALIVMIIIY